MLKVNYNTEKEINYYKPNMELSQRFSNMFDELIVEKECYDNIYRIVSKYLTLSKDYPNIKIVYGGVEIDISKNNKSKFFLKHCFFRIGNDIIDPTLSKNNFLTENTKYFSVIEYNVDEYFKMLFIHEETTPMNIVRELNEASLCMSKYGIVYVG